MNDALLMSVLNGVTDLDEQLQPFFSRELALVAILRDLDAAHQFHDEKWAASVGAAGVEDARDVRMIHQGEGLPFRFKTRDDTIGVHAEFDHLERDAAADRFILLSHVDDAAT